MRRSLASGAVLLALVAAFAQSASATVLPPSQGALPGSSFQGADGNQNDAAPLVDWQAFLAADRVGHSPDPNAQDSAFAGGSKENDPGLWALTVEPDGVVPDKANILDAWTAADQGGASTFAYLGFTRAGTSGGTSWVTFELNHDARVWDNGRATIPCRRTGDLLLSYEIQSDGVDVVLQQWRTLTTNLATGCATTGDLTTLTGLTPNVDAQGGANAAAILSRLPGFYENTVPSERFGEAALHLSRILSDAVGDKCFSYGSVWMHSRSSISESANLQDYVAPRPLVVRSCAASGTKFHDLDGDGVRDPGERGIPRWLIWADYNDDGVRQSNEPFGITDEEGQYVVNDIKPPDGTYTLRETLVSRLARRRAVNGGVHCSFPNDDTPGGTGSAPGGPFHCGWGPISTATTTHARGRDFGNYVDARLTVAKELEPTNDLGRFDLLVNGVVLLANAGDGASRSEDVRPGTFVVSETAAPGTNPNNYVSTAECKLGVRRARSRAGSAYADLRLASGQSGKCTFRNVRRGSPAIAIDKTGPATGTAGATLHYTLYVTNPGELPFPAASVHVTDANCDAPPALVGKADSSGADDTPGTLDPGDTWTYACSNKTSAPTPCKSSVVPNTATVTGATAGKTVTDSSAITTSLQCPTVPSEPPSPQPTPPPPPPSPVVPPGPAPPDANDAGTAGAVFRQATRGCIPSRVPRVRLAGTRIASVRILVNRRVRRALTLNSIQVRITPRVSLRPGRYRVTAHVTFQRGTGSPPVTLSTTIRVCAARHAGRPSFTG
jgi:hypothetical protein